MEVSKQRIFRHIKDTLVSAEKNSDHIFSLKQTLDIFCSNSCFTFIPKNGCSTMRFSIAKANGFVTDLSQIDWIHSNNGTFSATNESAFKADYTFVILRCPLTRLYSSFMDKIVNLDIQAWQLYNATHREVHPHDISFRHFVRLLGKMHPRKFNPHWRPQSHFLLYEKYDDVFALEDFADASIEIERKAGIQIVDTRKTLSHDISSRATYNATGNAADIPAIELLVDKRRGVVPSASDLFDSETTRSVSTIYRNDLELYEGNFGKSDLMKALLT